jgi:glutaredoxin-like YruB-family protein
MPQKPVKIYTTQTCQYCKATKAYFQEHGIEYTEVDVGSDADKAREMIQKSGQMGVPVIIVGSGDDEQLIVGYDQARIAAALGVGQ